MTYTSQTHRESRRTRVSMRLNRTPFEVLLVVLCTVVVTSGVPVCGPGEPVCEFTLVAKPKLTMMHGRMRTYPSNGQLYAYSTENVSASGPLLNHNVIQADGWGSPRLVHVFNDSLPGPAIEVWENQTVKVRVTNMLPNEALTVHWHGLQQLGTPFMDGVGFVSQCPILYGQTFTYTFQAYPKGTFWYHSQVGSQRAMGLYGALIVHEREPAREFTWIVSEWNHSQDAKVTYQSTEYGMYDGGSDNQRTEHSDSRRLTTMEFHSGLLNGKGRYYDKETGQHNGAPLSSFTVTPGESYRVRVIAAGQLYPFRVSLDQHLLTIIASDGFPLEPVTVQSFIINPGERFDFIFNASNPVDNYWIRGETLDESANITFEAILRYELASAFIDPYSVPQDCTPQEECIVANCPFGFLPGHENTVCLTLGDLRAAVQQNTPSNDSGMFQEHFLNFALPEDSWTYGSVNGKSLKLPDVAAVSQPSEVQTDCYSQNCNEDKVCKCLWSLPLKYGSTQQFVFVNIGVGKSWSYPIHLHGHSFHIIKMGYANYNKTTGEIIGDNLDIRCQQNPFNGSQSFCSSSTWSDPSWLDGNIPGAELERPPRKDTLIVPSGGYAVVRIMADNPGVWIVHSQIQLSRMDGMAILLNESFSHMPRIPENFPSCRSFLDDDSQTVKQMGGVTTARSTWTTAATTSSSNDMAEPEPEGWDDSTGYSKRLFWGVVGCLIAFVGILLFILVLYMCLHRTSGSRRRGYNLEPVDANKYAYQNKGEQF